MYPDKDKLKEMLSKMQLARKFEEKAARMLTDGLIHGTTHLYIGEEAVAAGICAALEDGDLITSTHRGHGHCIAKGMEPRLMMAELLGRATGCCRGRGGSMHMADLSKGVLGENGIVGGGCGLAAGAALALKKKGKKNVAVCFFGDGAANEGNFHEAANLASVWKLPVIFICENNQYGMSMSVKRSMNVDDISLRAGAYGFPGKSIDGNDAVLVYEEAQKAREYVIENGPMMLVCNTYRVSGHSRNDKCLYRTQEELEDWLNKDPVVRMRSYMLENGFSETELSEIESLSDAEIEEAAQFALESPSPSPDTADEGVYA